ncbi:MAG: proton-conducting transporter membrane subunit [Firmicutes bacterium]|nr:proton-conducting transporter membrane subunit [Bacillota bacterium]
MLTITGLIFSPIIISIIIFVYNRRTVNYLAYLLQIINMVFLIDLTMKVLSKGYYSFVYGGFDKHIGIQMYGDIYSIIFLWMSLIGFSYALIYIYDNKFNDVKFIFFLLFLEGVMNGLFLANDIFTVFILIELSTIIAGILIIYQKDGNSVKSGIFYLLYNTIGMTIYLLGVIFIYKNIGSLNIQYIKEMVPTNYNTEIALGMGMIITSLSLKSALFPVYSWLPYAHSAAPSSISALLSGLVVKIGIFGFIRIISVFGESQFMNVFLILGIITSVIGVLFAVFQTDIKRIMAFSTISQIGLILIAITSSTEIGFWGGVLHSMNHFFFKSLLFLSAGAIIYMSGDRSIKKISGMKSFNPLISIGLIFGILSITGAPFFLGSISKLMIKRGGYLFDIKPILYFINCGTVLSYFRILTIYKNQDLNENKLSKYKKVKSKVLAISSLSILMILVYIIEFSYVKRVYGLDMMGINILMEIIIDYLAYVIVAVILYNLAFKKENILSRKVDNFNFGFRESNLLLIGYMVFILGVLKVAM